jgi:hypothetical protein
LESRPSLTQPTWNDAKCSGTQASASPWDTSQRFATENGPGEQDGWKLVIRFPRLKIKSDIINLVDEQIRRVTERNPAGWDTRHILDATMGIANKEIRRHLPELVVDRLDNKIDRMKYQPFFAATSSSNDVNIAEWERNDFDQEWETHVQAMPQKDAKNYFVF